MSGVHQLPRDQLDGLIKIVRRALRYWWAGLPVIAAGVGLTLFWTQLRKPVFLSRSVVYYQEPANINLVEGGPSGRKMGVRLKETVMARGRIAALIQELDLEPEKRAAGHEAEVIEDTRKAVEFRINEGDTYAISFRAHTPELAQRGATLLTDALIEENARVRAEQAEVASGFLETERLRVERALRGKELALAKFLAEHPEFVGEMQSGIAGANRTLTRRPEAAPEGDSASLALRREERRLVSRLAAPAGPRGADPALSAALADAKKRLAAAERELADRRERFTEQHPDVRAAMAGVRQAEGMVARATEALSAGPPSGAEAPVKEKAAIEARLAQVRAQLSQQARRRAGAASAGAGEVVDVTAQRIIAIETEWAQIMREVTEARERYEALDSRQFLASLTASSLATGQVARIVVIDPAYLPSKPEGASTKKVFLAGIAASLALAAGLALLLGILDDRVYDRRDLERLELAPILVEIPALRARGPRARHG
jgi:uncharacterized protein involved in exopolysaccharide biosynthesis